MFARLVDINFHPLKVYLQYGVQVIARQFGTTSPASTREGTYVSIILALLVLVTAHLFIALSKTTLFHRLVGLILSHFPSSLKLILTCERSGGSYPTTGCL